MKKKIIIAAALLGLMVATTGTLYYKKVIGVNGLLAKKYEVRGVDVSHYQGTIDWTTLAKQDIDFAVIKATEGSSTVDEKFVFNWAEANKTDLVVGAYHFFSFDSEPKTQAENYIKAVGSLDGKMIPVVDFEFYGEKEKNPPEAQKMRESLQTFLNLIEKEYGRKPMIYATMKAYHMYLEDNFNEYPLWIRNVYYSPNVDLKGKWTLWQYSDRVVLDGYQGEEKYIDLNVFKGKKVEFIDSIS